MRGNVTLESVVQPTIFVVDLPPEPVPEGVKAFSRENAPRRTERVGGS
jgi:hypothetical protein